MKRRSFVLQVESGSQLVAAGWVSGPAGGIFISQPDPTTSLLPLAWDQYILNSHITVFSPTKVFHGNSASQIHRKITWKRDWRNYLKEKLCNSPSKFVWNFVLYNVQDCWNMFKSKLISCVDELVPLKEFVNNFLQVK